MRLHVWAAQGIQELGSRVKALLIDYAVAAPVGARCRSAAMLAGSMPDTAAVKALPSSQSSGSTLWGL